MNRKSCLGVFLIFAAAITALSGCERPPAEIYIGNSEKAGTKLVRGESVFITQAKEGIEKSQLVFSKNNEDEYENLYFNFEGNSIKSVDVTSSNHTVLYEHIPDKFIYCVDIFPIALYFDEEEYYSMIYTIMGDTIFAENWDNGEYDDVKNVYFNGMSSKDIEEYNDGLGADGVYISGVGDVGGEFNISLNDNYTYVIEPFERYAMSDGLCKMTYFDSAVIINRVAKNVNKSVSGEGNEIYFYQENTASSLIGDGTQSFLYRYELLFYRAQQKALKSKGSFDYSDLQGETIEIKITYNDDSTEECSVDISFDDKGNIIAALR